MTQASPPSNACKYPPLPEDDQIALLRTRKLTLSQADEDVARKLLRTYGFHALQIYSRNLLEGPPHRWEYLTGTTISDIVAHVEFQHEIARIAADACRMIELWVKATMSDHLATSEHGAYWWTEEVAVINSPQARKKLVKDIDRHLGQNGMSNLELYRDAADGVLLSWELMRAIDFGTCSMIYAGLVGGYKVAIARQVGFTQKGADRWFEALLHENTIIRNKAAHHSSLVNDRWVNLKGTIFGNDTIAISAQPAFRELVGKTITPKGFKRIGVRLLMTLELLRLIPIADSKGWVDRLHGCIDPMVSKYPALSGALGLKDSWQEEWKTYTTNA